MFYLKANFDHGLGALTKSFLDIEGGLLSAQLLDGKTLADQLYQKMTDEIKQLAQTHRAPGLAVIQVGNNPSSHIYVSKKTNACKKNGIQTFDCFLGDKITADELKQAILFYNKKEDVDGILLQLPLPPHLEAAQFLSDILPSKDVDGLCPENVGLLTLGRPRFTPCTPAGIMHMLNAYNIQTKGIHSVVVGRSALVGKPMASCLLQAGSTVTTCHSFTKNLEEHVRLADLVIAAAGKPQLLKGSWFKSSAVVVDVGINRQPDGKLVGDVEFDSALKNVQAISPVPGGVGPLTVAMLLQNTIYAMRARLNIF